MEDNCCICINDFCYNYFLEKFNNESQKDDYKDLCKNIVTKESFDSEINYDFDDTDNIIECINVINGSDNNNNISKNDIKYNTNYPKDSENNNSSIIASKNNKSKKKKK